MTLGLVVLAAAAIVAVAGAIVELLLHFIDKRYK